MWMWMCGVHTWARVLHPSSQHPCLECLMRALSLPVELSGSLYLVYCCTQSLALKILSKYLLNGRTDEQSARASWQVSLSFGRSLVSTSLCVCLSELMSLVPSSLPISFLLFVVSFSFISPFITPYTHIYSISFPQPVSLNFLLFSWFSFLFFGGKISFFNSFIKI